MTITNKAAFDELKNFVLHDLDTVHNARLGVAVMVALDALERMDKVEAAVGKANVIRCKDCKYGSQSFGKLRCSVQCRTMKPDDYCSYGEAKNE